MVKIKLPQFSPLWKVFQYFSLPTLRTTLHILEHAFYIGNMMYILHVLTNHVRVHFHGNDNW